MTTALERSAFGFAFFVAILSFAWQLTAAESPRIFILRAEDLSETKRRLESGDTTLVAALDRLKRDADRAQHDGVFSVTDKTLLPPSKDKHDYLSIAPYWWPNPNTQNGLPYMRRDGEINPERDQTSDRRRLDAMVQAVKTTALAYYLTGREDDAACAAKLLRVWFLDAATKMNPNLRYAQAVPGRNQGRAAGIIETHNLPELVDAVGLLSGSSTWKAADQKSLQAWFDAYLVWLLNDPQARDESKAENNHGTWYDVQVASYALFVNKPDIARTVLDRFAAQRIAKQIEPDGRQPRELARTQAWNYSVFNLEAFINAAAIGDKLGFDLWNYETNDKRGIRKALDWLIPFATGEKKWPYKQISVLHPETLAPLLRRAATRYREPRYEKALANLSKRAGDERWRLLNPPLP